MHLSPISIEKIGIILQQAISQRQNMKKSRVSIVSESGEIRYYTQEIFRHWNRINFIYQRLTRAFPKCRIIDSMLAIIIIFQKKWERLENVEIFREIQLYYDYSKSVRPNNSMFERFLALIEQFNWKKVYRSKSSDEQLSLATSTPSFIIQHLKPVMDFNFIQENLQAMYDAPKNRKIWVRLNTLQIRSDETKELIIQKLNSDGIQITEDSIGHDLYTLPMKFRNKLIQSELYQRAYFILHDKASIYPPLLLDPQPFEIIADLCAAPGIKAGILAQLVQNSSQLMICDFHSSRLMETAQLMDRWGVKNQHYLNIDSILFPSRLNAYFDRVLLDAPCTGSGTFLSNPELKTYQNSAFLQQNRILQAKLLQSALKILKPGGILVYSTCSLYPEEGEYQIAKILDKLEPCALPPEISSSYLIKNVPIPGTGRLFPAIQGTQGFFLAKFKKKKE